MENRVPPQKLNSNTSAIFKLNTNKYLKQCNSRDVILFDSKGILQLDVIQNLVFEGFQAYLRNSITHSIHQQLSSKYRTDLWLKDGEECEILRAGSSGWQKGKIKLKINVTLEFIPNEPEAIESPLDDVRQELNQNNS